MKYSCTIAAASALFSFVSAHGGVVEYSFGGTLYAGYDPGRASIKRRQDSWMEARADSNIQRQWDSYQPVDGAIGSTKTICNDPGSPATAYASIAAGGTVSACFNQPWAHNSGPLTVYMAACPSDDCTTVASTDLDALKWFAIYKEGLVDGKWATEAYMESNSNCLTHVIPETLVAGNYLIRHETINLAKVEFYANCANVKVTGSGTATPGAAFLKTIAEIYVDGDDALTAISSTPDSYTVPGPNVWPADTAEGGQVFEVTGIKNACSGKAQASGVCADGGDDTSTPTPPDVTATASTSTSTSSPSTGDDTAAESSAVPTSTTSSKTSSSTSSSSSDGESSSNDDTASAVATPKATATSSSSSDESSSGDDTASAVSTPKATATSSSSSSGSVAAYGQCGGGSVAASACVSGYTCKEVNEWYSQCV